MRQAAVLAVDAGGTNCRIVLSCRDGTILDYQEGGPCNYQNIGVQQASENLTAILRKIVRGQHVEADGGKHSVPDCSETAGGAGTRVTGARVTESRVTGTRSTETGDAETNDFRNVLEVEQAVIGIAGLDTPFDHDVIEAFVREAFRQAGIHAQSMIINNDGMITLLGSIGDQSGIIVAAGTGSIVLGTTKDGRHTRIGGWGHRIGDEGSGIAIGTAALRHIFRAIDGREPESGIRETILQELQLQTDAELMAWMYSDQYSVERVASFAPIIFRLADAGDSAALGILHEASTGLASACIAAIEKLRLNEEPFALVMAGSILQKHALVADEMIRLLSERCAKFHVMQSREPIYSALHYGLKNLGSASDAVMVRCARELQRWTNSTAHTGMKY